jgi:hypothetical protein
LRAIDHLEDIDVYGKEFKWIFKEEVEETLTGWIWFRLWTNGGLL